MPYSARCPETRPRGGGPALGGCAVDILGRDPEDGGQGAGPGADQEGGVIWAEHPGKHGERPVLRQSDQAEDKVGPVRVIAEDGPVLEVAHYHVVGDAGRVEAGLAWHWGGVAPIA